ncbi:thioesterase family protein [Allosalinactinospora lopnorensis]|uniref:thioesterase family protein n=1 Tax=Allosalinactinospora lopnorensis TaxID=1352348 RepID=UPI000623B98E|nr:thioesterase family protein [Allosalinactinospora lopnorensis]
MADAFYHPLGEGRFTSSGHTAGPWSPDNQHLGPPSALLTRELQHCDSARDMLLSRITVEVLGPVPIAELRVRAWVERPGKSVEMLTATLETEERTVARASAWRIARSDSSSQVAGSAPALAPVDRGVEFVRPEGWSPGYIDAIEWRGLRGALGDPGPATVWARQRIPLVAGERPTPLQRLMTVADSASGVSNRLDPTRWLFINTELTVHIQREPAGEWIGLDANTVIGPEGVGTAVSVLHDEHGQVGNTAQALLVRRR